MYGTTAGPTVSARLRRLFLQVHALFLMVASVAGLVMDLTGITSLDFS
jgi:hypothetical protein